MIGCGPGFADRVNATMPASEAAVEALRKARTIDRCRRSKSSGICSKVFDLTDQRHAAYEASTFHGTMVDGTHEYGASLFLDGFSVDEITAAEEALE